MTTDCLVNQLLSLDHLLAAWEQVRANRGKPGGDGVSLARFRGRLEANLLALADEVRAGAYRPGPVRIVHVLAGGKRRTLSILPVRDRVLQRAALDLLEPILDPGFLARSYGYRPGRSLHDAVAHVVSLRERGHLWVVDADVHDCFGSLDHALLERFVDRAVPDPALARLVRGWIDPTPGVGPRRGIALGAPISPLLCNLYLHRLDLGLRRRRLRSVRYADDFVVLCRSEAEAEAALAATADILSRLKLTLNPRKTRVVGFADGFDFLGIRFEGSDYHYVVEGKRITVDNLAPAALRFGFRADPYG